MPSENYSFNYNANAPFKINVQKALLLVLSLIFSAGIYLTVCAPQSEIAHLIMSNQPIPDKYAYVRKQVPSIPEPETISANVGDQIKEMETRIARSEVAINYGIVSGLGWIAIGASTIFALLTLFSILRTPNRILMNVEGIRVYSSLFPLEKIIHWKELSAVDYGNPIGLKGSETIFLRRPHKKSTSILIAGIEANDRNTWLRKLIELCEGKTECDDRLLQMLDPDKTDEHSEPA